MGKIAIHGFGRIGRTTLRIAWQRQLFQPAIVSDIKDPALLAALLDVDTNYGRWQAGIASRPNALLINGREIPFLNTAQELPDWGKLGIDLVIDCTGRATTRAAAQAHIDRGAKRVLVSAPSKSMEDCDAVILPGINPSSYQPGRHRIISMGSCTTNGLAPVIKILLERFGIAAGFFSTVHSYTNTQSLTDQPMRERRDSWAAAENIIPSSSGAAKALLYIWPDLKISGKSYRVPTRTGSIAEVNALLGRDTSAAEVRDVFRAAAAVPPLQGIMDTLEEEWPSARIVGDAHSCIIDLPLVQVIERRLVSIAAWYDNEFGFSSRLAEMAAWLVQKG